MSGTVQSGSAPSATRRAKHSRRPCERGLVRPYVDPGRQARPLRVDPDQTVLLSCVFGRALRASSSTPMDLETQSGGGLGLERAVVEVRTSSEQTGWGTDVSSRLELASAH